MENEDSYVPILLFPTGGEKGSRMFILSADTSKFPSPTNDIATDAIHYHRLLE